MKKSRRHERAFNQMFKDGETGLIKIDSVCYKAIPVSHKKQVTLGVLVIFRKFGNVVKDVGYVDGIEWRTKKEVYTVNSIPTSVGGAKSKLMSFRYSNLDYTDISHVLEVRKPADEKEHSS